MFLFLLRWIFFTFNSASPQLLCAMSARNLRSHLLVLLCFQLLYFSTTCATCATCTTCATCAMLPLWVIWLQPTICATCATFKLWVLCLQLFYICSSSCAIFSLLLFCSPCIACHFCAVLLYYNSFPAQTKTWLALLTGFLLERQEQQWERVFIPKKLTSSVNTYFP